MSYYSSVVLGDSPIRYYRLDESSGTVATDLGSQGQNGTIVNGGTGVLLGQSSLIASDSADTAMKFVAASTGKITLPTTGLPTGANAWTVDGWVSMSPLMTAHGGVFFLGTATGLQGVQVYYNNTNNKFECYLSDGTDFNTASGTVTAGVAYHLAVTYDGTTVTFYINGSSAGTHACTLNLTYGAAAIGNEMFNSYYGGIIDEFAIYSTQLSATRVLAHYSAGATSRVIAATAALQLTSTRTIGSNTAALQATNTRTIGPNTAALLATSTRTISPVTAALLRTATRTIGSNTAALQLTQTRTISATAALSAPETRTVPCTAALSTPDLTRTIPCACSLALYIALFPSVARRTGNFPARARRGVSS